MFDTEDRNPYLRCRCKMQQLRVRCHCIFIARGLCADPATICELYLLAHAVSQSPRL